MIRFNNWHIDAEGEIIARQHDNLTRRLDVMGDIPDGWVWSLLTQAGTELNVITLEKEKGGLGITLTAQMLSRAGYWRIQLRGTQGELVRHTNVLTVYIPTSLSGDGRWPQLPSEFSQAEARLLALNANPPKPGAGGTWLCYDPDQGAYMATNIPLPAEGIGGITSQEIQTLQVLDRGEYDALASKDPQTLYLIRG